MLKFDDKENETADNGWKGARVFVAISTSGLSASLKPPMKEAIRKPFGEQVYTHFYNSSPGFNA